MKITKEIVEKTAHLARLEFSEEEKEKMVEELQQMVNWMDKLNEIDTEGVEPHNNMSFEINALREDKEQTHVSRSEAFKNAPDHTEEYFRVPKVIKK